MSVCSGAFILAATGLLDNRKCTTHWSETKRLARNFPAVKVMPDALYTRDGRFATSAGITAGIDLSLALLEEDHGVDIALEVARFMVLYLHRPGEQSQFSPPLRLKSLAGKKYAPLHDWILSHITSPLQIDSLAERQGMSVRNFARDFAKTTGITPGKYVEELRFGVARELLESSDLTTERIAELSGFQREERLRRVCIRLLGITPGQYRLHFGKGRAAPPPMTTSP